MSSQQEYSGESPLADEAVKVRLKWFNSPKGFGFVVPETESIDVFLHVTTLKRAGVEMLGEGASLLCHIERGPRGAQVREIVAILDTGFEPEAVSPKPLRQDNQEEIFQVAGAVKWYTPEKGYGFVKAEDGQKDIFLHKNCLQRYGMTTIEPLTWLLMAVRMTPKGREVVDFEFLDD